MSLGHVGFVHGAALLGTGLATVVLLVRARRVPDGMYDSERRTRRTAVRLILPAVVLAGLTLVVMFWRFTVATESPPDLPGGWPAWHFWRIWASWSYIAFFFALPLASVLFLASAGVYRRGLVALRATAFCFCLLQWFATLCNLPIE